MFATTAALALALLSTVADGVDPRAGYDVQTYRLDLEVDPATETLSGTVTIEARVVTPHLAVFELDLNEALDVRSAIELTSEVTPRGPIEGEARVVTRGGSHPRAVDIALGRPREPGESIRIAVTYSGHPREQSAFEGFHWKQTADKRPWISVACQGVGSSWWWPCKDSFWHPEDKPERTFVNATVPKGLYAVSNGRLTGRDVRGAQETFHWVHEYPCETYSITLDVAPYVVVEQQLADLPGLSAPLDFVYYVLPEDVEKAKVQFADVPKMLAVYSRAFGAFPYPKSKYALVETSFWGMEHSTAVAYGSSFPAWCGLHGETDRYASMNKRFDYILVHESAHEWWGNGVSARSWGHFWLHEGFGTYAEAVYLEFTQDRAAADAYFKDSRGGVGSRSKLYRGDDVDSGKAYSNVIYTKGAWVLNTLRHCVADDAAWWKSLADFNLEFRYKNAVTEDFRAVLERNTHADWKTFFDEWVYGTGYPELKGTVKTTSKGFVIDIEDKGSADTGFHVPIDLAWRVGGKPAARRVPLAPGANHVEIALDGMPTDVVLVGPERILGRHAIVLE